MRIVAGKFKRATLKAPPGQDVRPTTDRVREAIFNSLMSRVDLVGAVVLDLFAGTGALGLEALSRGAERAVFVETSPSVLQIAKSNAKALGVESATSLVRADVFDWQRSAPRASFDVVFADPPYGLDGLQSLPALTLPLLREGGLFVLEHDARHGFAEEPSLELTRAYGRTVISMFAA